MDVSGPLLGPARTCESRKGFLCFLSCMAVRAVRLESMHGAQNHQAQLPFEGHYSPTADVQARVYFLRSGDLFASFIVKGEALTIVWRF